MFLKIYMISDENILSSQVYFGRSVYRIHLRFSYEFEGFLFQSN